MILSGIAMTSFAGEGSQRPSATIAVLPFANYSGNADAQQVGDSLILRFLNEQGWTVIPRDSLRQILRKHRIRAKNGISAEQVAVISAELSVDCLLIGSFDIYDDKEIPETAVSFRIIDCENQRLIAAASSAASGEDYAGLFGMGRITSIIDLNRKVITRAFADLNPTRIMSLKADPDILSAKRIAVVPFDNFSPDRNAGDIISSILISELIRAGWDVILPGDIFQLSRSQNRVTRGEIDLDLMRGLAEKLKADYVITGSVFDFASGTAGVDGSTPKIELNGRLIDSRTGRILSIAEIGSRGTDSELLFRSGTCYSLGKLAQKNIRNLRKKIAGERITNFADND